MNPVRRHLAAAQSTACEPYEIAEHKRAAARHLSDDAGWYDTVDYTRALGEAAEALDDDDLTPMRDSDLAELLSRVDIARAQITAEMDRRKRRAKRRQAARTTGEDDMSPTVENLRLLINLSNHIHQSDLDPLSDTDLISLETRLAEWRQQVSAEWMWRHRTRRQEEG